MNALKTLVIAMGALIVIGIGLVGYGLTRGKAPQAAVSDVQGAAFASRLQVPPGARLEQVAAAGDRVVLRFTGPDGDKLLLVDSHTGQVAGTINLIPDTH